MDQRTYELVAKFISDRTGMQIQFENDICPQADPINKVIRLPYNIKDDNVFGALAVVMHEAAHIEHSVFDQTKITNGSPTKFEILNAAEDIRIDCKNFGLLPNIKDFYRELFRKCIGGKTDEEWQQAVFQRRVLATLIADLEGFRGMVKPDKPVDEFIKDNSLEKRMCELIHALNSLEYHVSEDNKANAAVFYGHAHKIVDEIHKILGGPNNSKKQKQQGGSGDGDGEGEGQDPGDDAGEGDDEDQFVMDGNGKIIDLTKGSDGKSLNDFNKEKKKSGGGGGCGSSPGRFENIGHHNAAALLRKPVKVVFESTNDPSRGKGSSIVGEVALEEATKHGLRELLNEKCIKQIPDGTRLDTDSLHSFFTGDIDELFVEHKIINRKKSKIILMLDASGSMQGRMMLDANGRSDKRRVILANAEAIKKVLDEVVSMEGMNVVYEVWAFDDKCWKLDPNNYQGSYNQQFGGGTDILLAFDHAHKSLCEPEVEGERLLILLTDGEVHQSTVDQLKRRIFMSNSNAKVLIVGVSANISGHFVKEIIGGNNILAEQHSNIILLEAIMTLLGG